VASSIRTSVSLEVSASARSTLRRFPNEMVAKGRARSSSNPRVRRAAPGSPRRRRGTRTNQVATDIGGGATVAGTNAQVLGPVRLPVLGRHTPARTRTSVVFPDPFPPKILRVSPSARLRLTPEKTKCRRLYDTPTASRHTTSDATGVLTTRLETRQLQQRACLIGVINDRGGDGAGLTQQHLERSEQLNSTHSVRHSGSTPQVDNPGLTHRSAMRRSEQGSGATDHVLRDGNHRLQIRRFGSWAHFVLANG